MAPARSAPGHIITIGLVRRRHRISVLPAKQAADARFSPLPQPAPVRAVRKGEAPLIPVPEPPGRSARLHRHRDASAPAATTAVMKVRTDLGNRNVANGARRSVNSTSDSYGNF